MEVYRGRGGISPQVPRGNCQRCRQLIQLTSDKLTGRLVRLVLATVWRPNEGCLFVEHQVAYSYMSKERIKKSKAVPLHAMEALEGRGGIAPTHSRPRH
jgi:hypothetical protein